MLVPHAGEIRIDGTLPVVIPGLFSLRVRFINNEEVSRQENIYLWDPSLADTKEIDVAIPREELPIFKQFSVKVAIRHGTVNGPFTQQSNGKGIAPWMIDLIYKSRTVSLI